MSLKARGTFYISVPPNHRIRLLVIVTCVFAVFAIIGGRLFYLQILKHDYYLELAQRQQSFSRILEPRRGDIYFKTKDGEAIRVATTQIGALLYLNNKLLIDKKNVFTNLNGVTPIDQALFDKISKKENDPYEVLKHKLTVEEAGKILSLNMRGVGLAEERWRFYPANSFGGHVIGFVSSAKEKEEGQYGIEKYFDSSLKGESSFIWGDKDAKGFFLTFGNGFRDEGKAGEDIFLTIEPNVQARIEKELALLKEQWSPFFGGILVLNPKNGRIVAMAATPFFDPNQYQKEKNFEVFLNPFTEKIFELGSVFKPLTMAAALDRGALTPETTYNDTGEIKVDGRVIKNFDGKVRGIRTMTQVLEESLNTGAVFAMQKLGEENLKKYFYDYGLGEKTGIELPGELKGDLSNLNSNRKIEFATAAFGQGIAVTPLEFSMALASLANGGNLVKPTIVDGNSTQIIRRVVAPKTSETITKMLVDVVDTALAGGKVKMQNYSIAAKTGTAQIPASRLGGGKGYSDEFLHSFFGYFPAYDPKFLVFMFLERPQGVRYASQSLSDSFRSLVEFLINYYTISPDR